MHAIKGYLSLWGNCHYVHLATDVSEYYRVMACSSCGWFHGQVAISTVCRSSRWHPHTHFCTRRKLCTRTILITRVSHVVMQALVDYWYRFMDIYIGSVFMMHTYLQILICLQGEKKAPFCQIQGDWLMAAMNCYWFWVTPNHYFPGYWRLLWQWIPPIHLLSW